MNTIISNSLSTIFSFFRNLRAKQVLIIVLAGFLMVVNTACQPPAPKVVGEGSYNEKVGQQTELYDPIQRPTGGMNNFTDTEPNVDANTGKARTLIQESKQNLRNRVEDAEDYARNYRSGNPLGERIENITEPAAGRAERVGKDVVEGTQRGVENLKNNTQDAGRDVKNSVENTADNVQQNTRGLARDAQRATERTSSYAQEKAREANDAIRDRT